MTARREINLESLLEVAKALGELNERTVYVGGAVVSLYVNDPAADEPRPTRDIDVAMEIATVAELEKIRQQLALKGFHPDPEEKVICRMVYRNILVDILSTAEVGWAPSNPWFKEGFEYLEQYPIGRETVIRILPLSFFLAAKFAAFHNRSKDPRSSHDLEDILHVLDNRMDLEEEVLKSPDTVRVFLMNEFRQLAAPSFEEAVLGHLNPFVRRERYELLMGKLKRLG